MYQGVVPYLTIQCSTISSLFNIVSMNLYFYTITNNRN